MTSQWQQFCSGSRSIRSRDGVAIASLTLMCSETEQCRSSPKLIRCFAQCMYGKWSEVTIERERPSGGKVSRGGHLSYRTPAFATILFCSHAAVVVPELASAQRSRPAHPRELHEDIQFTCFTAQAATEIPLHEILPRSSDNPMASLVIVGATHNTKTRQIQQSRQLVCVWLDCPGSDMSYGRRHR